MKLICTKCKLFLEGLTNFTKDKSRKKYGGYSSQCKECRKKYSKLLDVIQHRKEYKSKNKERYKKYISEYIKKRKATDENYRFILYMRNALYDRLYCNKAIKSAKTVELFGADLMFVKKHITKQFKPGMSWNRIKRKLWHIDHIKPVSSFDLTDPAQQKQCFHYTNLQPLWASENLRKGCT